MLTKKSFPLLRLPKAFTLVELIVVVTILAILATVGFASYTSHLSSVRDTTRIKQLGLIRDNLDIYRRNKKLPLPSDYIEIKASGTVIGYQGYAGESVLSDIKVQEGGKDPMDKTYYTYYVTKNKKNFQLLAFLEEEPELSYDLLKEIKAETADYEDRYAKVTGDRLGILTESGSNTPVQEVSILITAGDLDIATTIDSYIGHISNNDVINGTGGSLSILEGLSNLGGDLMNAKGRSCNEIQEKYGKLRDGVYRINSAGNNEFKVYCDMTKDGGGWTLIYTDKDFQLINRGHLEEGLGKYWEYLGVNSNIPKDGYIELAQNTNYPFRFFTDITGDHSYFLKIDNPSSVSGETYWGYLVKDGTNITNYKIWMGKGYSSSCYQTIGEYDYAGAGCTDKGSFNHSRAISYGDIYDWCSTTYGCLREGNTSHCNGATTSSCVYNQNYESGSNTWSMWIK